MKALILLLSLLFSVSVALGCNISAADFEVSGSEAVHKSTGLVWKRCPLGYQLQESDSSARCVFEQIDQDGNPVLSSISFDTFGNAMASVNALPDSWRLPNEKEAASVVDFCSQDSLMLKVAVFPKLDDTVAVSSGANPQMLTANATTMRLFKQSSSVFSTNLVDSSKLNADVLIYSVKTADPLQR